MNPASILRLANIGKYEIKYGVNVIKIYIKTCPSTWKNAETVDIPNIEHRENLKSKIDATVDKTIPLTDKKNAFPKPVESKATRRTLATLLIT